MAERVGHRCMVHLAEAIDAELRDEDFYGAAIVSYSLTARPWNYIIHFDDGTAERVRLPDSSIRMLGTTLLNCNCVRCGSRALPLPWGGVCWCCMWCWCWCWWSTLVTPTPPLSMLTRLCWLVCSTTPLVKL